MKKINRVIEKSIGLSAVVVNNVTMIDLRISAAMTSLLSLAMVENFLGSLRSLPFTFPLAVVHEGMGQ